jgi:hypothetical protein
MELAVVNLKSGYQLFEQEFRQFFPELQYYVNSNFEITTALTRA